MITILDRGSGEVLEVEIGVLRPETIIFGTFSRCKIDILTFSRDSWALFEHDQDIREIRVWDMIWMSKHLSEDSGPGGQIEDLMISGPILGLADPDVDHGSVLK